MYLIYLCIYAHEGAWCLSREAHRILDRIFSRFNVT